MSSDAIHSVVVAGGGPAALEAVLTLRDTAPGLRVTLLVPEREYVQRALSVFDPFAEPGLRRYPFADLAELGVDIHHDALLRVDPDAGAVRTTHGAELAYDALLLALGSQTREAIPRALSFGGPAAIERMRGLVQDAEAGYVRSVAFAAPPGTSWTLPLYELALQLADRLRELAMDRVALRLVSHEARPLEVLGTGASDLLEQLLEAAGIAFAGGQEVGPADRVVALPVPAGRRVAGLPAPLSGFFAVDEHGRVRGARRIWAAGDCADHPVKQGGLAAQEAAAAAASIAAAAIGAAPPEPDDLVLRAMLITPQGTYFLRRRLDGLDPGQASARPLWWPPSKVAGPRLTAYLDARDAAAGRVSRERLASSP